MKLEGPYTYNLVVKKRKLIEVIGKDGDNKFRSPVTSQEPKLYTVSIDRNIVYVGITKQPIRSRLRIGFAPDTSTGYHGYPWANNDGVYTLAIWIATKYSQKTIMSRLESVEAEVAFLVRTKYNQWPTSQSEIHFHQSTPEDRKLANQIFSIG